MKGKISQGAACALIIALAAVLLLSGGKDAGATQEEKRIAQVLSAISGAGRVEVAIFYAQQDVPVFGTTSATPVPTGAVVVAEGAEEMAVRLQLIRAMRTLLGLPESAVDVFDMEEGRR